MQPKESDNPSESRPSGAGASDGRALAAAKRAQMRLRARRIRRTIATGAAGLFATAFLGIYVQLASGHDPALVAAAARRSSTSTNATASTKSGSSSGGESSSSGQSKTSTSSTSSGESSSTGEESSSSSSATESSEPSSVTTSQS